MADRRKIPIDPTVTYGKRGSRKPLITVDWKVVNRLLISGCSGAQIAAYLGFSADTLYMRCLEQKGKAFSEYAREKRAHGDSLLHDKQFEIALKGDKAMLIWLGKQRLKQRDKIEQEINSTIEINQIAILELPDNGRRFITT